MNTITYLAAKLSALAAQYPNLPVSFQLSNGTEFELETNLVPYEYHGVIVVPIYSDDEDES